MPAARAISAGTTTHTGRALRIQRWLSGTRLPRSVSLGLGLPFARAGRSALTLAAVVFGVMTVTLAVGGIRFVAPVRISDLVAVSARLSHTGTSSMHFAIEVRARDPMGGEWRLCTHCVIVFVALDGAEGRPVAVPAWLPVSDEDKRMAEYALKVMELSKGIEQTIAAYQSPLA